MLGYGLLFFSSVSAGCWYAYYNATRSVARLKDAARPSNLSDLVSLAASAPNGTLPYAVIEGQAFPSSQTSNQTPSVPLKSLYAPADAAPLSIIRSVVVKEHKTVWNKVTKAWDDIVKTLSQSRDYIPMSVVKDNISIRVEDVTGVVDGIQLQTVFDKFEPVGSFGFTQSLVDWASGDKTKGLQYVESVLPVGSPITIVGQISLNQSYTCSVDDLGVQRVDSLVVRAPLSDRYFITMDDFSTLLKKELTRSNGWKYTGIACTAVTLIILYYYLRRKYSEWSQQWEMQRIMKQVQQRQAETDTLRRQRQMNSPMSSVAHRSSSSKEVADERLCCICMDQLANTVILECAHACICQNCTSELHECPLCRSPVSRTLQIYL